VWALIQETLFYLATHDSLFFDSPLNEEGMTQAEELEEAIHRLKPDVRSKLMEDSVYVVSNLRRAVTTLLLGFRTKFEGNFPNVRMWTCLQEISRNIDTISNIKLVYTT
jgi:hypothetical protein